jgi:lipoprotein NlpI
MTPHLASSPARRLAALLAVTLLAACGHRPAGDPQALESTGVARRDARDYAGAVAAFDQAIAIDSTRATAWRNRGIVRQRQGDDRSAVADFDRAIALKPDFARAYGSRGFSYQLLGEYAKAVADYDKALALDSTLTVARENRGRAQWYLGNLQRAADDLVAARPADSTNLFLVLWAHMAAQRIGRPDSARFAAWVVPTDSVTWPAAVARLYLGRISPEQLVAAAGVEDGKTLRKDRCHAFYIGEYLLWHGDTTGAARHLDSARADCPKRSSEYQAAVADLGRIAGRGR